MGQKDLFDGNTFKISTNCDLIYTNIKYHDIRLDLLNKLYQILQEIF